MSSLVERQSGEPVGWRAFLRSGLRDATTRTVVAVYVVAVVLVACTRFVNTSAGSANYVKTVVALATFTAVVSFGQGLVVLTGGFDLSIPATMTFAAVVLTQVTQGLDSRATYAIPLVLGIGALIGLVNGLVTVIFRISPIVVTLATNTIVAGLVLVYTNGQPTGSAPSVISKAAVGGFFGKALPALVVVLLVFLVVGTVLMNKTTYGRRIYATGEDARVAALSGISTPRVIVSVYVLSGISSVIGGMLLSGFSGQSYVSMGDPYLLLSLAAVMVGGASVTGGKGLYVGTVGGAVILQAISTMLAGTTLPNSVQDIVYAAAILVAVVLARVARRPR
jgi:ribose transport system permease protein